MMRKLLLAASFSTVAGIANATVLDFESLATPGTGYTYVGASYTEDGFTITQGAGEPFELAVMGLDEGRFPGSTALFNDTIGGSITLTRNGGGTFGISAIDVSELNGPFVAFVTFVGTFFGGGTISQVIELDGTFGFETFSFGGSWTNLVSISWTQDSPFHQFDNIVLNEVSAPVPVPAGGLLLLGGLAALVTVRRRKAQC